jgi:hypothetical protein
LTGYAELELSHIGACTWVLGFCTCGVQVTELRLKQPRFGVWTAISLDVSWS